MVALMSFVFSLIFIPFCYALLTARTRRGLVAVALAGVLLVTLAAPPAAHAQTLLVAINAVLSAINGAIGTALNAINSVRMAMSNFYQQVTWPVALINQAKALIAETIAQFRGLTRNIFDINLSSATLDHPGRLESVARNHQTGDFGSLATAYGNTYGGVPAPSVASPEDRAMMDMDDALVLDNLKMLKQTDAADDLTLQAADDIEDAARQAAPGSAPLLTASAVVASVQSQALMQKMIAAELRQEAACLAHDNALRKRGAGFTGDLNTQIWHLLQKH